MSALPDRQTLEAMKRVDLQRLCKDHGLKANLKSEALIDLLLETSKPMSSSQTSQPKRSSSLRIVSRASSGVRPRGHSGSSVIIHDSDEEHETEVESAEKGPSASQSHSEPEPTPPAPPTRIPRKAKEAQYRLGVGRPVIAGGSGARAVTKSVSISKSRRGKGSRSVKPNEAPIQEEEEESETAAAVEPEPPQAGPSGTTHDEPSPTQAPPTATILPTSASPDFLEHLKVYLSELVTPLQDQIQMLQSELQRTSSQLTGNEALQSRVSELAAEVQTLRAQASQTEQLEAEVNMLKEQMTALNASNFSDASRTRRESGETVGKSSLIGQNGSQAAGINPSTGEIIGGQVATMFLRNPPSALGKRSRDSQDRDLTGVIEAGQEGAMSEAELATQVLRPPKKILKLSQDTPIAGSSSQPMETDAEGEVEGEEAEPFRVSPGPGFTVFSGPEEPPESYVDPPPPTQHLSDLFALAQTPNASSSSGVTTSTANANENQQPTNGTASTPYNFTFPHSVFDPMTSTPAGGGATIPFEPAGMPSIPYPARPTSPTPGAAALPSGGYIERAGGRRERNDLFNPFGAVPRPRSTAGRRPSVSQPSAAVAGMAGMAGSSTAGEQPCISPALLSSPSLPPIPESRPGTGAGKASTAVGQGMGMVALPIPPETPAPPMKRTMYGTELEGDTRFGDFGVEGVATGFWTGVAPRF